MYAYLRKDGLYDVYSVEPKVITAEEYAKLQRVKELEARKTQLLTIKANADAELSKVTDELEALTKTSAESAEPATLATTTVNEPAAAEAPARRKW